MSLFRNPIERYKIIHKLLITNQRPTWKVIAEIYINSIPEWNNKRLDQVKRIVYLDIESLKISPYDAPIISEKARFLYDPNKPNYSFLGVLNQDEVALAYEIQGLLKQYADFPVFKGLEDTQLKITERFNKSDQTILEFEQNKDYVGLHNLKSIYEFIKSKKAIKLIYTDFSDVRKQYTISPYLLKEYKDRWHVYGWNHIENDMYNFPLDRITSIETSGLMYKEMKGGELDFLKNLIGFTWKKNYKNNRRQELEEVIFKVVKNRAQFIETKPIHHTQEQLKHIKETNYKTYSIKVYPNDELTTVLLSFGADLEIIKPLSLRNKIVKVINKMNQNYQ
jgi:predicted DNA-binding transcriptional regulator YafY